MRTVRLNPLDASWLYVESRESPMHVANLQIFSPPKNAPGDFLRNLVAHLKTGGEFHPPWNLKLASPRLKTLLPVWRSDDDLDLDYHVRHSALPKPGGERELGMLVSRLHTNQLDFTRPPWECHIIEGLEGGRFAMYTKMHHSLIDGISGIRLLNRIMSDSPDGTNPPPWCIPAPEKAPRTEGETPLPTATNAWRSSLAGLRKQVRSVPELARAVSKLATGGTGETPLTAPFSAPVSILNGRITAARRFATWQFDLARLKRLAKAAECSLNDVVLALCASALRRFLKEGHALPQKTLTSGIPVNVRPADDQGTGNAISFIMATLATDVADPRKRLEAIKASTTAAKDHLQSLPRGALTQYTLLTMAPYILMLLSGLGGRVRPVFNVTISNVPGPDKPMYMEGAKLEAMYPVSLVTHGQALNITCVSYAGTVNFGFTGARDTLPHMQHLAVYAGDALEELEHAVAKPRGHGRKSVAAAAG